MKRGKRKNIETHIYRRMKHVHQNQFWQFLLSATFLLALAGCTTYPVQVSTETEQKAIWVQDIQFGKYRLPGGSMGGLLVKIPGAAENLWEWDT